MCGIVGVVDLAGKNSIKELSVFYRMTQEISHRGPDDEGYLVLEDKQYVELTGPDSEASLKSKHHSVLSYKSNRGFNLAFGHKRFSIFDLSSAGHQPMLSNDGRYAMVHNGEIYNFIELREELENIGHIFHSHTDTEVILKAYMQWGENCFEKFNGIWSLAIFDKNTMTLTLCRDRIGKLPLYIWEGDEKVVFASEIKSLLLYLPDREKQAVQEEVAAGFLLYGLRDLFNHTFYRNIHSLPPATIRKYQGTGQAQEINYWRLPQVRKTPSYFGGNYNSAAEQLLTFLKSAVELRLRADVPVTLELSGGMDSSTMVALVAHLKSENIPTFTIRFPDKEWNEEPFAREVAERYKIDYRIIDPPLDTFWDEVDDFIYLEEEPFHSPNLHTLQHIQKLIADEGYKVVISGAGGDELFAGYLEYYHALLIQYWNKKRYGSLLNQLFHSPENNFKDTVKQLSIKMIRWLLNIDNIERTGAVSKYLNLRYKNNLVFDALKAKDVPIEELLLNNMNILRMPYWLRSGDKTRMSIPVERRAPFLDYRVMDFVFSLPIEWLIRDGWLKWILRKTVEPLLPHNVVWRKKKMGFPYPLKDWLKRSHKQIESALKDISNNPYLNITSKEIYNLVEMNPQLAWRILSFEMWHKCMIRGGKIFS